MYAEFQTLSPLVPVRPIKFLRFCKQPTEGVWAIVDVSVEGILELSDAHPFVNCRRLPSGCIVQDLPNGSSKVISTTAYYATHLSSSVFIDRGFVEAVERYNMKLGFVGKKEERRKREKNVKVEGLTSIYTPHVFMSFLT